MDDRFAWKELAAILRRHRLWLAMIVMGIYMFAQTLMIPYYVPLSADYFSSKDVGSPVHCADYKLQDMPEACKAGSATTVTWIAGSSFVSNAVLGLTLVPLAGWLSDQYGRKPFLIAAQALASLPIVWAAIYMHNEDTLPFTPYYALRALTGAVQPVSIFLSFTADIAPSDYRAPAFSVQMAGMSVAAILGAAISGFLGPLACAWAAIAMLAANAVLIAVALPESLSDSKRVAAARERSEQAADTTVGQIVVEGLRASLSVLFRSKLFFRLAVIMALTGMVFECMQDVLFNYFMVTLGYVASDFANVMIVYGVGSLIVQTFVLPTYMRVASEKVVLTTALIASTLEMTSFSLAMVIGPASAYIGLIVGSLGSMAFPVISAIKSVHSTGSEQGKVQGALFGARALAQGTGPLFVQAMFHYFTKPDHYFPPAPIVATAVVMAGATLLAATLHVPHPDEHKSLALSGDFDNWDIESPEGTGHRDHELLIGNFLNKTSGGSGCHTQHHVEESMPSKRSDSAEARRSFSMHSSMRLHSQ